MRELIRQGKWLFVRRGHLPIALLLFIVATLFLIELRLFRRLMNHPWYEALFETSGLALVTIGLGIRFFASGYAHPKSSEGTTSDLSTDALNTTGLYSIIRHPLYFGNFLMWIGAVSFTCHPLIILVVGLAFWIYYERIILAEEAHLEDQFGDKFHEWKDRTPVFFPNLFRWNPPAQSFRWARAIRREYHSLTAAALVMILLDVLQADLTEGDWLLTLELEGISLLSVLLFYFTVRYFKKRTDYL